MRFALALLIASLHSFQAPGADAPGSPSGSPKELVVFPKEVKLVGPRDEQRIVAIGVWADGRKWDLTRTANYTSGDAKIATVDKSGIVRPVADGTTTITIDANGAKANIPVSISKSTADLPVNFTREIEPILTKAGCNSGGCHGSQHGKGGFRLSLFAFDPRSDFQQIVNSNEGRRIVPSDPERSIFLAKPALVMEHGGGEKLKLGGRDYNRIKAWLEDGSPAPLASPGRKPGEDLTVTKLEIFPTGRVMQTGEQQQLVAIATWSDGTKEDVTPVAQFDALNDSVASVTANGLVTAKEKGETHVMIRFGGMAEVSQVSLPFAKIANYPAVPENNFIDQKLIAKWKELGLVPSPLCSDEEFLRRLFLDAIGTLPTPDEVRAFLADKDPKKREKAIDKVLERGEFTDWWALKWGDLLRINRRALQEKGMWSFHNWVRAQMRDNVPLDAFARDIVTAEGSTFLEGPANFYRIGNAATDWAETTAQVFLGIRVGCAKCHHHPFEKWSQDDYYGLVAFFSRLGTKGSQEFGLFGAETVVFLRPGGEASHPRKGGIVKPMPLDGNPATSYEDEFDRRKKLAEWLGSPDNRMFSRNLANRFWGYLMGRGLVEPLDDMRSTNPASNPELLDALADELVKSKFSMKHLLRTIFASRAYQLDSAPVPENAADGANIHFTRYTVKRLTAEQLADALDFATGTREKYAGLPLGTRAIQLPDSEVNSYLMDTFGRPAREVLCECERTTKPNIAQAMHLLNGTFLNAKIANKTGRIEKLLAAKTPMPKAIEELWLATWCRPPTKDELAKAEGWVKSAATPAEGLQDVLWVLINSREFLFNR